MERGWKSHQRPRVLLEGVVQDPASLRKTRVLYWVFPGERVCVGRSREGTDFAVEADQTMSKQHFEVSFDGQRCELRDLNSTNGTMVNGERVTTSRLGPNDRIRAGLTEFTVGFVGSSDRFQAASSSAAEGDADGSMVRGDESDAASIDDGSDAKSGSTVRDPSAWIVSRGVTLRLKTDSLSPHRANKLSQLIVWLRAGESISVGKSAFSAGWRIPDDDEIADQHFQLTFDGHLCSVENLDEQTETLVNGQAVKQQYLKNGDVITAGRTNFVVEFS
jgi:pSer/pThr/pTyr-binding forkhead associated (FHA) protein